MKFSGETRILMTFQNLLLAFRPARSICRRWQQNFDFLTAPQNFDGMLFDYTSTLSEISQSEALYWCFVVKWNVFSLSTPHKAYTAARSRSIEREDKKQNI